MMPNSLLLRTYEATFALCMMFLLGRRCCDTSLQYICARSGRLAFLAEPSSKQRLSIPCRCRALLNRTRPDLSSSATAPNQAFPYFPLRIFSKNETGDQKLGSTFTSQIQATMEKTPERRSALLWTRRIFSVEQAEGCDLPILPRNKTVVSRYFSALIEAGA